MRDSSTQIDQPAMAAASVRRAPNLSAM